MAIEYIEKQLNKLGNSTIVLLFLAQQSQLKDIDNKLQLAVMNSHRFGKSSKKTEY